MKTGLVLEGGGLRGMFTAGVMDAMMEHGVQFDGLIGVSAGALFGCNYKSRQPGRVLRYNIMLKDNPEYMSLRSLWKTGNLVGTEMAYRTLPFQLDPFDIEAFQTNPMEFWMVCTDITNGEPVYHQMSVVNEEEMDWMRASGSMPVVSQPVHVGGRILLDGGMSDAIPLKAFQQMGYDRNIVVLTQPRDYFKTPTHLGWVFRHFCKKYPQIAQVMARRHLMYNGELEYISQQAQLGNTLLIYPDRPLGIGRTELNERKMRNVHQLGYDTAISMMDQIRQFLGNA